MHDAVLVLVETFNKLLWKKPDMFKTNAKRTLSNGNSSTSSGVSSSQPPGLDCNSGRSSGNQWEHGEKISRFLRKVSATVHVFPPENCIQLSLRNMTLCRFDRYSKLCRNSKVEHPEGQGRVVIFCNAFFSNYNFVFLNMQFISY